jgi:hypothetical protein
MADGPIETTIEGRPVIIMSGSSPSVVHVRLRTVTEFSIGRIIKLFLCWLGVPLGPLIAMTTTPGGPGQDFGFAWFVAGLVMLGLNAAGVVTVRGRRQVPMEGEDG